VQAQSLALEQQQAAADRARSASRAGDDAARKAAAMRTLEAELARARDAAVVATTRASAAEDRAAKAEAAAAVAAAKAAAALEQAAAAAAAPGRASVGTPAAPPTPPRVEPASPRSFSSGSELLRPIDVAALENEVRRARPGELRALLLRVAELEHITGATSMVAHWRGSANRLSRGQNR
jgi:SWI/SNF-related matrix-associated actin-dependent regulator 1 of chromatin subfamily A